MTTINIPTPSLSGISAALAGSKTYLLLISGAIVILANHFGVLPPNLTPPNLNATNWISDLFTLALGGTFRSALGTTAVSIASTIFGFLQPATPATPAAATSPTTAAVSAQPAA